MTARHVRDWSLGQESRHTIPTIQITTPSQSSARQGNYTEGANRTAPVIASIAPDGGPPDEEESDDDDDSKDKPSDEGPNRDTLASQSRGDARRDKHNGNRDQDNNLERGLGMNGLM